MIKTGKDDEFLNRADFDSLIRKFNFDYNEDQIEDLFVLIDCDKDYRISFKEFQDIFINRTDKSKLDRIIQKLRRTIFNENINLQSVLKNHADGPQNSISFKR